MTNDPRPMTSRQDPDTARVIPFPSRQERARHKEPAPWSGQQGVPVLKVTPECIAVLDEALAMANPGEPGSLLQELEKRDPVMARMIGDLIKARL